MPVRQPAYAALAVQTREFVFIEMWAGQMLNEAFNWVLKHLFQEERPQGEYRILLSPSTDNLCALYLHRAWNSTTLSVEDLGSGHGFPSSHSQWMGYFAAFLICHFTFRHRFVSTGWRILDLLRILILYSGILAVSMAVAYSR